MFNTNMFTNDTMQDHLSSKKMITFDYAKKIFERPFLDLIADSHAVHVANHVPNEVQASTLLSVQTGGCCEDCAYCAQSIRNGTKAPKQTITDIDTIMHAAQRAKDIGSSRFCMGTSGRTPSCDIFKLMCEAIKKVKKLGLETCVTMGMLNEAQVIELKACGLDFYNHNIDTSPEYYGNIITTRTIDDRVNTINLVQKHGIKVCTGGIIGMGETNDDRIKMLVLLANLDAHPASISINRLVKVPGTRLEGVPDVDPFDFVRCIALARILMPASVVRISAGRESMSDEMQALCLFAGAGSIFLGETLLTAPNAEVSRDLELMNRLNIRLNGIPASSKRR
ncbi:MAG: biotin synthase BioB [Holosporales bacterium]|jgi:biotin synthase|nr:biotin synthase BioB [Holosporales bacterium]